jgi:hypothetical protein
MKTRLSILVLLILNLAVSAPAPAQDGNAEQEIRTVLAKYDQAKLKGGAEAVATFDKILTEDYLRVPPNGVALTKEDLLNYFKAGRFKLEALENSNVRIHTYGQTAVATGIAREKGSRMGVDFSGKTRWIRVLVNRGGGWQISLFQSTKIKSE